MTTEAGPVRVVVTFSGPNTADGVVSVEGRGNVGQLALAGLLVARAADQAQRGAELAIAQDRHAIQAVAAGITNGRRT